MDIATDDVEPPSFMGTGVATEYILGIAKARGKIKILLDIDRVLSNEELTGLQQAL
jgi:purine-binding chemotaxis protein CheW